MRSRSTTAFALAALLAAFVCDGVALAGSVRSDAAFVDAGHPLKASVDQLVPSVRGVLAGFDSHFAHDRLVAYSPFAPSSWTLLEGRAPAPASGRVHRPLRIACPPQGPPDPA